MTATGAGRFKMQKLVPGGVRARQFMLSHSGAVAVEFAIVLAPLMLILFTIISFASTLFLQNNMVNAAREAVRQMAVLDAQSLYGEIQCGQVNQNHQNAADAAEEAAIEGSPEYIACNYLIFWGTDFDVDAWDTCPGGEKAKVKITLDASQAALMDIFGFFDGKTLTAEVSMRKEDACV